MWHNEFDSSRTWKQSGLYLSRGSDSEPPTAAKNDNLLQLQKVSSHCNEVTRITLIRDHAFTLALLGSRQVKVHHANMYVCNRLGSEGSGAATASTVGPCADIRFHVIVNAHVVLEIDCASKHFAASLHGARRLLMNILVVIHGTPGCAYKWAAAIGALEFTNLMLHRIMTG